MEGEFNIYPWGVRGTGREERAPKRRYITVGEVKKYGPTKGCSACEGHGKVHNQRCHKRFEELWEREGPRTSVPIPAPQVVDAMRDAEDGRTPPQVEERPAEGVRSPAHPRPW